MIKATPKLVHIESTVDSTFIGQVYIQSKHRIFLLPSCFTHFLLHPLPHFQSLYMCFTMFLLSRSFHFGIVLTSTFRGRSIRYPVPCLPSTPPLVYKLLCQYSMIYLTALVYTARKSVQTLYLRSFIKSCDDKNKMII